MHDDRTPIEIKQAELAVRICEGITGTERPGGFTPTECLAALEEREAMALLRVADIAMQYLQEVFVLAGQHAEVRTTTFPEPRNVP